MRDAIFLGLHEAGAPVSIPFLGGSVRAGFPSPADDFAVKRQDLNELLITHPNATFFWESRGLSMLLSGIGDRDILVVNRALTPPEGSIVVAAIDNDFTVKHLHRRAGSIYLRAADPTYPVFRPKEGQTLIVYGLVTASITRFRW